MNIFESLFSFYTPSLQKASPHSPKKGICCGTTTVSAQDWSRILSIWRGTQPWLFLQQTFNLLVSFCWQNGGEEESRTLLHTFHLISNDFLDVTLRMEKSISFCKNFKHTIWPMAVVPENLKEPDEKYSQKAWIDQELRTTLSIYNYLCIYFQSSSYLFYLFASYHQYLFHSVVCVWKMTLSLIGVPIPKINICPSECPVFLTSWTLC